ncbi:phosphatidylserine/phosphatidylglycerophosphate/cardiolipin synthase-like enzyme [Sphingobium sp. B7D2B]|uniref:phospholipase D-like domain-containing protein n=1 Tax=unclassified Sphingobium TaxID=2611147 RepID=UPI002223EEE6|nr:MULTISPECIES: phospholipase D-like domain-containing protein [unclassified Sphingobium]MCW2367616.1 phosphatidylserine/phosphatidylglycerophosphate/cardiolipin synthase-like enzyme [Sphingobium sp. B7D2B]MCW2410774.1 phosphatidylserine/phosphatidylglycerophosphate/cardiolipin synthase-like enzyme [Sphingobium sp. B8D3D]MCW2416936.1 phosphatidylserine/phosphatidylglycerophosphate/cardiolipin synthase-like enzyme [Sphingobium sp. B8D3A]
MKGNYWRAAKAAKACVIVDAEDYFRFARQAMIRARKRIMLVGWDFDARIELAHREDGQPDGPEPTTIGDLIYWLVETNPELEVYLLRWDLGAIGSLFRGKTIFTVAKWAIHPRIHVKLDAHHPTGGSHHQKIVVIDDCFAFCGGIDMTGDRWDTRAHRDEEPERHRPGKGPAYMPWHDATTALQGPAAAALGEHSRDRWKRATGQTIAGIRSKHDVWPEALPVQFEDVEVLIARTAPKMPDQREVTEIEQLYIEQIGRAKRWIYAESQYFASRRIAEAMARRLDEPDGPEIVIVNPEAAQGWLEPLAMDTARARLVAALRRRDKHGRFRLYHPVTRDQEPIYVHAKVMIVDDMILRVGSSNMNARSLRLDTECDVAVDCSRPSNSGCSAAIAEVRNDLLAEHLDASIAQVEKKLAASGSLIETIEALRFKGRKNAKSRRRTLVPYEIPDLTGVEAWLADNQILDPEGPDDMFEALSNRGLLRRLSGWRRSRG